MFLKLEKTFEWFICLVLNGNKHSGNVMGGREKDFPVLEKLKIRYTHNKWLVLWIFVMLHVTLTHTHMY